MADRLFTVILVGIVANTSLAAPVSHTQSFCQPDQLDIKHQPQMIQAAEGLGIDIEAIRFQACNSPSFNTAMVGSAVTIRLPNGNAVWEDRRRADA